jgi:hypothetical protein
MVQRMKEKKEKEKQIGYSFGCLDNIEGFETERENECVCERVCASVIVCVCVCVCVCFCVGG